MTEDFKKGLATGIAIGGVTVNKQYGGGCIISEMAYSVILLRAIIVAIEGE